MVPNEIKPAEGVGGLVDNAAGVFVLPQVRNNPRGAAARLDDLRYDALNGFRIDVHNADGRPLPCKAQRPGAPHAGARCRHHADSSVQSHRALLY